MREHVVVDADQVLSEARSEVLDAAYAALSRGHETHYEAAGEAITRDRLGGLYDLVVDAIARRDLSAVTTYGRDLAGQRFQAGFDIAEVQTAFNALEQAMWRKLVAVEPPEELAEAVGLLGTVLGAGKDAVAREYVSLASSRHVPTLDLSRMFDGTVS